MKTTKKTIINSVLFGVTLTTGNVWAEDYNNQWPSQRSYQWSSDRSSDWSRHDSDDRSRYESNYWPKPVVKPAPVDAVAFSYLVDTNIGGMGVGLPTMLTPLTITPVISTAVDATYTFGGLFNTTATLVKDPSGFYPTWFWNYNLTGNGTIILVAVSKSKCNNIKFVSPVSFEVKSVFRKEKFGRAFPV